MYQLAPNSTVVRLADDAVIPADPGNRDYQEYLAWIAAGNQPDPAPETTPVVAGPTVEDQIAALKAALVEKHGAEFETAVNDKLATIVATKTAEAAVEKAG